jgi:hypothetical protein
MEDNQGKSRRIPRSIARAAVLPRSWGKAVEWRLLDGRGWLTRSIAGEIERREDSQRLLVRVAEMKEVAEAERPRLVRVTIRKAPELSAGQYITGTARPLPPPQAAWPGAPELRQVVTTEVSKPTCQRANRRVPDVCNDLGGQWCDSFTMIGRLDFSTNWRARL